METTAEAVPVAGQEQTATSSPATRSTLSLDKEKFSSHNASLEDLNVDAAGGAALPVPAPDAEPEQPVERHDKVNKNTLVIVLSLCVCVFLSALDQTIITTAIPVIAGEFHSPSAYTWIGSSYMLASASFLPSWGKFSDIWGRKPVLLAAAVLFMIGSVLCAAANGIVLMLVGRVLQGLGAGGQLGLVNVTISDIVTVRQRGLYLSYVGMTWAAASAVGPVLGGVFTGMAKWGWRFCFIINIPVGFIAILGLVCFLHLESPTISLWDGLKRVDWLGTSCIVTGVILFLLALEFGGISHPWNSPIILCFLIFGIALLIFFVFVEYRIAALPVMPLRLFNNRTNVSSYLVGFCHGFVFIAGCYFLPLYFQAARGDTPLMSGVYVLPYVISLSLMSGVTGFLISKTGQYQYLVWGGAVVQAIGVGLIVMLKRKSSWAEVIIFQLIMGTGSGPLFQAPLIAIHSTINPKDVATATSTFAFLRTLGTALAISLGLTLFQNGMSKQAGPELQALVGEEAMQRITGTSASASVEWIKKLPDLKRFAAQDAYAKGMTGMWWFFLGIALVAVLCSAGIGKHHLSQQLTSTQPVKDRKKIKEEKEGVVV